MAGGVGEGVDDIRSAGGAEGVMGCLGKILTRGAGLIDSGVRSVLAIS